MPGHIFFLEYSCFRLFVSEERTKLPSVIDHLQGVKLLPYSSVTTDLSELIKSYTDGKLWISKDSSHALVQLVPKERLCSQTSPIQLLKGIKNETEIYGMKMCHVR